MLMLMTSSCTTTATLLLGAAWYVNLCSADAQLIAGVFITRHLLKSVTLICAQLTCPLRCVLQLLPHSAVRQGRNHRMGPVRHDPQLPTGPPNFLEHAQYVPSNILHSDTFSS